MSTSIDPETFPLLLATHSTHFLSQIPRDSQQQQQQPERSTIDYLNQSLNSTRTRPQHLDYYGDIMALYMYRSIPYTLLAAAAALFNAVSLVAILKIRKPRTVYHSLLANLAAGDVIGSLLVWLYHNAVLLYPHFDSDEEEEGEGPNEGTRSLKICLLKSAGLLVPILLAMTNSVLALLMLSVNQYLAICRPLFAQTRLAPEKARMFMIGVWIASVCSSFVPVLVVLIQAYLEDCSAKIQSKMITSLEVCAYLLASLIMVVIFLYARIYREVLKCRKRSMELSVTSQKVVPQGRQHRSTVGETPSSSSEGRREQFRLSTFQRSGSGHHGPLNLNPGSSRSEPTDSLAAGRSRGHQQQQQQQQQPLLKPAPGCSSPNPPPPFHQRHGGRHQAMGSPETNYKAFMTTLLMTGTLLLFWLPYLLVSSSTIYSADAELDDYPDALVDLKFYLVDFLPLVNYISDPIVYGVRIRCVRLSLRRLFGRATRNPVGGQGRRGTASRLNTASSNPANGRFASGPATIVQDFSFCS